MKWVYTFGIFELVTVSPRFGLMLAAMCLSIVFIIVDTCSVLGVFGSISLPVGIEPFWKVHNSIYIFHLPPKGQKLTRVPLRHRSHSFSNISATPPSSTTSKQPLIVFAPTESWKKPEWAPRLIEPPSKGTFTRRNRHASQDHRMGPMLLKLRLWPDLNRSGQ
jgi:hypothetical protein